MADVMPICLLVSSVWVSIGESCGPFRPSVFLGPVLFGEEASAPDGDVRLF